MALIRCEDCGEEYSDTYQVCPFCEEEEAIEDGRPIHRKTTTARNRSRQHILSVLTMLAVVVFLCGGVFLIWGDDIAARMGIREPADHPDHSTGEEDPPSGNQGGVPGPGDPDHEVPEIPPETDPKPNDKDPDGSDMPSGPVTPTPETPVKLSSGDVSMNYGEKATLTASGGSGVYTWTSSNTALVTVANGSITVVGGGGEKAVNATVTVSDGYTSADCVVRIRANSGGSNSGGGTTAPPASGGIKLNRDDFTIAVGETFRLTASGNTGTVTWSVKDSSVATIAADGTVTGVKKGRTQVTAAVDGQTLQCWVSIK